MCEEVEKLVGTDYILPRTRAALIRTYGTFNDSRRLLSSARKATAELPEVLSAVMDVATATSSATLAELLQRLPGTPPGDVAGSLLLFFASHFEGVGVSTREVNTEVLRAEKLFIDAALHMSLGQFGRKNSCHDPVHERKPH